MLAPNKEIERSLPHAFEAERELLGAMLVNNEVRQLVRNILNEDDFYEGAHGRIYRTASRLIDEGKTVTAVTLMPLLRDDEALKELDGGASSYISGLVGAVTTIVNAPEHARIIAECARQRRVAEVGRVLSEEAQRGGTSELNHLVGKAMEELLADSAAAGQESTKPSRYTLSAAADKVVSRVNDAFQIGKSAENMPYPGLDVLAGAIGSFRRKRLYTVGARTSIGKTTFVTSLLLRTAISGYGVLVFELEMEATEIAERCLSDMMFDSGHGVPYERIARDDVSEQNILALIDAREKFAALPFRIEDKSGLTVVQVRAIAHQVARDLAKDGQRLDVVCIDHMGLLKASERYSGNKVAETEEISGAMKQMAKDLDVAVVNVMQLNRAVEARENKAPTLADLRWSGSVEQDSDVVMLLHRPGYYIQREYCATADEEIDRTDRLQSVEHLLEVNIAKNRGGACPQLKFYCDMAYSAVRDMEDRA